jgi:hypothetical protein
MWLVVSWIVQCWVVWYYVKDEHDCRGKEGFEELPRNLLTGSLDNRRVDFILSTIAKADKELLIVWAGWTITMHCKGSVV